jgi:hypothetical protein
MEDHHWGGQGWNSAVEPNEEEMSLAYKFLLLIYHFNICEISSSHGSEYDVQNCLLGCTAV